MMLYFNMALPFVALVCLSAIAMADPLVPTPNNLTDVTLSPRDVNVFICSWKVGDGSPQDLGYAKFCDARKEVDEKDKAKGAWRCVDGGHDVVADIGFMDLNRGILKFKAPCPQGRGDGFGWLPLVLGGECIARHWGVCIGPADRGAQNIHCLWHNFNDDCTWPDVFDIGGGPATVSIWSERG